MSQRLSEGRRRSRSLCGLQAKNFHETIPNDLPESERLLKLIEMSYKYALKEALKHAKVKESFDSSSVWAKGEEHLKNAKEHIIEKNLHKLAVEKEGQEDETPSEDVIECNKHIKLFKEEEDKWISILIASRADLEKGINASYSFDASTVEKNKDYNYDDVLNETSKLEMKLSNKIASLSDVSRGITTGLKLSQYYEAKLKRDCARYYHEEISNSPGTMLRRMPSPRRKYL